MLSIVIPAHNEEAVIARGLRAILTGAEPGELEVIVACNGCTDRTAEIARSFAPPVSVLEIPQASKSAALNVGDEAANGFPRFYVDADVVIDLASIRAVAAVLERGDVLMANPQPRMNLSKVSWPVRAFYRVWLSLPYNCEHGMVGTGVYAISREGRARFDVFPEVIADDGFVRSCFGPSERTSVGGAYSRVLPPRTLGALLRVKTRGRLGLYQVAQRRRCRSVSDRRSILDAMLPLLRKPATWPCILVYLAVTLVARWRARRLARRSAVVWERDEKTREPDHDYYV